MTSRAAWAGLLFALPMIVLFAVFRLVPTLGAVALSFGDYRLDGSFQPVGLRHYQDFFASEAARTALSTTLWYAAVYVPLMLLTALATALIVHRIVWGAGVFRGMMFLPYVTSFVLAGVLWSWLLGGSGPLNALLGVVGVAPVPFLTGAKPLVLTSVAVVSVWRGFGYSMLILLAGLKAIPRDVHEAAVLDGASAWQRLCRITLPLLRPALFFVVVIETIAAFQVFDTVYTMTGGGPARASYTLVYHLYESGFRSFRYGYAAAVGMVLFAVVLAVSLLQRRLLDRPVDA